MLRKSHLKQALLAAMLGPLGLCYVSINAALSLTLLTLVSILLLKHYSVYFLLISVPLAIALGLLLVNNYNRRVGVRSFTLSTYIGRVSCKIIDKTPTARSYKKVLAKARLKNTIAKHLHKALAALCIIVTGFIAAPNIIKNVDLKSTPKAHAEPLTESSDKSVAVSIVAADDGKWTINLDEGNAYSASLSTARYENSSDGLYRPSLTMSCINNKTSVTFNSNEILGTETTAIGLSIDDVKLSETRWPSTTDYKSASAPKPINLARQLIDKRTLEITFHPFGSNEHKLARFNLTNSNTPIETIKKHCSW